MLLAGALARLQLLRPAERVARSWAALPVRAMTRHPSLPLADEAAKNEARKRIQAALKELNHHQMRAESAAIAQHVLDLEVFQQARHLAIYVHCPRLREVDTTAILQAALARSDAKCYVPRVQDRDANMHFLHIESMEELHAVPPFGIREPLSERADGSPREDVFALGEPLDLVVMPGLAFNARGHRLGRGGGYYDKFIATCGVLAAGQGRPPPLLVALAFRAQMVDAVPVADNDEDVDLIVTADGVLRCTARAQAVR